ncbi:hypothetical protein BGZ68_002460 [Mortierella alpina]|nr:hypothetical protein BGZ68_002460 [Mortierella alpina]
MSETQSFRVAGSTTYTEKIEVHNIIGQNKNIIYWEDIELVFPGVRYIRSGSSVVPFLRNSDGNRLEPLCIQYHPNVVLDVVLSSAVVHAHADFPLLTSSPHTDPPANESLTIIESNVAKALQVASAPPKAPASDNLVNTSSSARQSNSKIALSLREVAKLASNRAQEFNDQIHLQALDAKMERMLKLQEAIDAKQAELNQMQCHSIAQQREMKQLQQEALDRQEEMKQLALDHAEEIRQLKNHTLGELAVLQDRVKALLSQTYELHEYPIPRLFVVLPEDPSKWDTVNPFSNRFRLYFLCEGSEQCKSIDSQSKISDHIHAAMHEGYEINRPSEFFKRYGAYALIILKMLKFGVAVAGVAVPALPLLMPSESMGQIATSLKYWEESIELGVNQVISHIDEELMYDSEAVAQMKTKEALEGADLRKLDTFLKTKDGDKVLGNLYRIVTDKGHVKWVCIDHYRENYQESTAKDFQRILDSMGGSFDKSIGRVEVTLSSKVLAEQFSLALGKARSVYELDVNFGWACSTSDLEVLEKALKKSRVAALRLDIRHFRASNLLLTSAQYGVLLRIKGLPNMRALNVVLSKDIVKVLSIQPKKSSCQCKLTILWIPGSAAGKEKCTDLAEALKTNSTLTTLDLRGSSIGDNEARALAEALKANSTLTTLDLRGNSIGDDGARALAEALRTNSTLAALNMSGNSIGLSGHLAFLELCQTNRTLTALDLRTNEFGDKTAKALAEAFKSHSALTTLDLTKCLGRSPIKASEAKAQLDTVSFDSVTEEMIGGSKDLAGDREDFIEDSDVKVLAEALTVNSTLTTLGLNHNYIGGVGAKALADALKTNSTLVTLHLRGNSIGGDGAKAVANALRINSTLVTLDLRGNLIGDDGAEELAEALRNNSTLATLNLTLNFIKDDGAKGLAVALRANSALAILHLTSNSIGDDGAKGLAEALKHNSTLAILNLTFNFIGSDGAKALADALKINTTLSTLHLMTNLIGDDGAKALADALKTNKTLATFNLISNSIGDDGAIALADALKTNSTLTTLDLKYNVIGDIGAKALAEALRSNSTLTTLDLRDNSIGDSGTMVLAAAFT